jgi:hypothetical protein
MPPEPVRVSRRQVDSCSRSRSCLHSSSRPIKAVHCGDRLCRAIAH